MTIVIKNLISAFKTDAIRLGAKITNEDDSFTFRAQFENCRMYVRDRYVKIRDQNHNIMILDKDDFSEISIF